MTRWDVVTPLTTRAPPNERTKLLDRDDYPSPVKSAHTKHVGLLVLVALVVSWVLQVESSQSLQKASAFNKPFFLMCYNHAVSLVILPLVFGYFKLFGTPEDRSSKSGFLDVLRRHSVIPFGRLSCMSAFLGTFYCVGDYFWFSALANVKASAGIAIFNCSPLFVYCFSICFLHEHLSYKKLAGVFVSFLGVILIVMFQNGSSLSDMANTSLVAGLLVVISAALFAAYQVSMQLVVGEELTDTATILIMAGLCGLFAIPFWVLGNVLLNLSPWSSLHESLALPDTAEGVLMFFVSGAMSVLLNVFLPLSLCWTSPLETSVGCMMTIPLSGLTDALVRRTSFSWECILGSVMVMAGFGILECSSGPPPATPHRFETPSSPASPC